MLPVKIVGSKFLRPINFEEKIGSAQCKSSVMLAALKTPGVTKIKKQMENSSIDESMLKENEAII